MVAQNQVWLEGENLLQIRRRPKTPPSPQCSATSDERQEAELKAFPQRLEKILATNMKSIKSLEKKEFACEADALSAAADLEKTLKYHRLSHLKSVTKPHDQRQVRPRPGDEISHYTYHIQTTLIENEILTKNHRNQAGRFILAINLSAQETNFTTDVTPELDEEKWTGDLILKEYKAQQSTERGFRLIKAPLFFVSRVFLKNTQPMNSSPNDV